MDFAAGMDLVERSVMDAHRDGGIFTLANHWWPPPRGVDCAGVADRPGHEAPQLLEEQQRQQRDGREDRSARGPGTGNAFRSLDFCVCSAISTAAFIWLATVVYGRGPAGSGKTTLLREGYPSDIIYAPEALRGGQRRYVIAWRETGGDF